MNPLDLDKMYESLCNFQTPDFRGLEGDLRYGESTPSLLAEVSKYVPKTTKRVLDLGSGIQLAPSV